MCWQSLRIELSLSADDASTEVPQVVRDRSCEGRRIDRGQQASTRGERACFDAASVLSREVIHLELALDVMSERRNVCAC